MPKSEVKKRPASANTKSIAGNNNALRLRKATSKQDKAKAKDEVSARQPLPGSFALSWHCVLAIKNFWRPLFGIVAVYAVLNLVFVTGLAGNISSGLDNMQGKSGSEISGALSSFGDLLGTSGSPADSSGVHTMLFLIESLVIIWALRHLLAGEKIKIKQAYYNSMAPLIPFLLVVFVIILQLIPLTIGSGALVLILSNAVADSALVGLIAGLLFVGLTSWSLYMLSSSVFAIYIVALPNMQPRYALRTAKNIVRFRRWQIIRKVLFLPLFILVVMGIVIVPLIMAADFLVMPVFFILTMLAILYAHTYLYSLYKGLI